MIPDTEVVRKPLLRGWIHAAAVPGVLAAVVVLGCRALTPQAAIAVGVFGACAIALFSVSAVYHLGQWPPRVRQVLRSIDHANITLLIAGTYTPVAMLSLHGATRVAIVCVVWTAAVVGMAFRITWAALPRKVYVPLYVILGWAAMPVLPQLLHEAGAAAISLIAVGGVLYTLGALAYGLRRPDPWPRVFGYHEVFHTFTVAAFACQYIAVWLIVAQA